MNYTDLNEDQKSLVLHAILDDTNELGYGFYLKGLPSPTANELAEKYSAKDIEELFGADFGEDEDEYIVMDWDVFLYDYWSMVLEFEDLGITIDEINHEDFPNNLTEEQRIVGKFHLPIMKEFGIKYSEYNHEDFQKNFTEEQSDNLGNCLEIMERFGYELILEVPPSKPWFGLSQEDMDRKLTEKYG